MGKFIIGFLGTLFIVAILCFTDIKKPLKKEYYMELIDQHRVKIKSLRTGKVYTTSPEKIHEVLDKDNL